MNALGGTNLFGLLTFIVAPAILTNASSVMALGTSNRFARAIDRARALYALVEGKNADANPETAARIRQLRYAEKRALFLVRALTAFYLSVGAFAAASLISLLGAIFFVSQYEFLHILTLAAAFVAGLTGIGGLVTGSACLVWETRMALKILRTETEIIFQHPFKHS